jgi:hypothetical protein
MLTRSRRMSECRSEAIAQLIYALPLREKDARADAAASYRVVSSAGDVASRRQRRRWPISATSVCLVSIRDWAWCLFSSVSSAGDVVSRRQRRDGLFPRPLCLVVSSSETGRGASLHPWRLLVT